MDIHVGTQFQTKEFFKILPRLPKITESLLTEFQMNPRGYYAEEIKLLKQKLSNHINY